MVTNVKELLIAITLLEVQLKGVKRLARNCVACDSFDIPREICIEYNARPPASVIVTGCDKFSDEVPF